MKTKLAGKVLAGMFLVLCCGVKMYAQSTYQAEAEFNNLKVVSFGQGGQAPGVDAGEKVKHKAIKWHRVYAYRVMLLNGMEKEVRGRIKYEKEDSVYTLASKTEKINVSETQYIYRVEKASGDTIAGTAYGNSWLFPVIKGKINGFSTYAENSAAYVTHFSRNGSGQLQSLNSGEKDAHAQAVASLAAMVTGNEVAEQLMREHKHQAKRKVLIRNIALGGLGFTLVGVVAPPLATAFIVGVPVGLGAGVATATVRTVGLLEVINTYNNTEAIAFF